MKTTVKGLKPLDRGELKSINGGYVQCPANLDCGEGWCCIGGGCRPKSQAGGPNGYCMVIPFPLE